MIRQGGNNRQQRSRALAPEPSSAPYRYSRPLKAARWAAHAGTRAWPRPSPKTERRTITVPVAGSEHHRHGPRDDGSISNSRSDISLRYRERNAMLYDMSSAELPHNVKTYRASANIAAYNKSCPGCSQRIRVGQPVIFAAPSRDFSLKPVAHHASCVSHRIAQNG